MPEDIYQKVVAPTLSTGAAFIGITTLGDDAENNFVGELINVRDKEGERLFHVINIDLVCDKCRRLGKEMSCQHKMGEVPYWQDEKRHADIQRMMPPDVFLREMRNIQSNPYVSPAFNSTALDRLERDADHLYHSDNHVSYIFVSVDPAAGGDHSKFAVVSCIYDRHKIIIVGAESGKYKVPHRNVSLLINHIVALRKIQAFQSARIVFVPESNLAFEGIWINQELMRTGLREVCVMTEDENRAGVKVNKDFKKLMAMSLNNKLLDGSVYFYRNLVCCGEDNSPEEMHHEIIVQLRNYCRILRPSRDMHKPPSESYGGKRGHGYDDHAIALMLNLVMRNRFMSEPKYSNWRA